MKGVHTPTEAAISLTLISPERYTWLHAAHSRLNSTTNFTRDLLKLMPRYHPRAKSLNLQGRTLKLANYWAISTSLRQAIESTFLTTTKLFGSPLNCSMSINITFCSAFREDAIFEEILISFLFRLTRSCIANLEDEQDDMLK